MCAKHPAFSAVRNRTKPLIWFRTLDRYLNKTLDTYLKSDVKRSNEAGLLKSDSKTTSLVITWWPNPWKLDTTGSKTSIRSLQGGNPPLHWQKHPMCSTTCSNDFLSMKKTMKKTIHERVVLELGTSHSTAPPAALHRALVALQRTGFTLTSVKPAKAHQFHFCGRVEINLPVYGLIPIYVMKGFSFENSKVSKAFLFKTLMWLMGPY